MLFYLDPGGLSYLLNKLEQLEFKLEKIIGIQKHAGKVKKRFSTKKLPFCLEEDDKVTI